MMERPDLSNVDPQIRAYIEYLERKLFRASPERSAPVEAPDIVDNTPLPAESPTSIHIITVSQNGLAKRTPRHLYPRQHRSGMGIFDLDIQEPDFPVALTQTDDGQSVLLFTNKARVFRHGTTKITAGQVHNKGEALFDRSPLDEDETVTAVLPERASGYVAILSERGRVRVLRHHLFGEHMKPGTVLYRSEEFGHLVAACWTPGDADIFIASRNGQAIRFSEKLINPQGDWGIKLAGNDRAVAITSVEEDSGVFLATASGRGTIRLMSGFAANKSSGGSGKIAMKTDELIAAAAVTEEDEIFMISRLGKIIRFPTREVPPTEGVVQGVYCMGLRGDEVSAAFCSTPSME